MPAPPANPLARTLERAVIRARAGNCAAALRLTDAGGLLRIAARLLPPADGARDTRLHGTWPIGVPDRTR